MENKFIFYENNNFIVVNLKLENENFIFVEINVNSIEIY